MSKEGTVPGGIRLIVNVFTRGQKKPKVEEELGDGSIEV